jgi:hypothetical protein
MAKSAEYLLFERVSRQLRRNERLIWAGCPDPRILLKTSLPRLALFLFGVAIFVAGLVDLAFPFTAVQDCDSVTVGCSGGDAGTGFLVLGFIFTLFPVLLYLADRSKIYAVTSERLLVMTRLSPRQMAELPYAELQPLEVRDRGGGFGDVIFRKIRDRNGRVRAVGFHAIPDFRSVKEMIEERTMQAAA